MTEKPTKKTDLSAFGTGSLDVLKSALEKAPEKEKPAQKPRGKRGPAPRPDAEKRTETVSVRFTPGELQHLTERAGDVPLAVFILRRLQEAGVI